MQLDHILVFGWCSSSIAFTFTRITENSDAPLIVSVLQFLLQHQVDNEGLPGQGLAPGVPTILKIISIVFFLWKYCFLYYQGTTWKRHTKTSYLDITPHRLWVVLGLTNSSRGSLKRIHFQNILYCSTTDEIQYNKWTASETVL